jgi:hypothetical protein
MPRLMQRCVEGAGFRAARLAAAVSSARSPYRSVARKNSRRLPTVSAEKRITRESLILAEERLRPGEECGYINLAEA